MKACAVSTKMQCQAKRDNAKKLSVERKENIKIQCPAKRDNAKKLSVRRKENIQKQNAVTQRN